MGDYMSTGIHKRQAFTQNPPLTKCEGNRRSSGLWTKNHTGQAADGTEMFNVSRAKGKTRLHGRGCDQSIG
jgi:hypothetical protein